MVAVLGVDVVEEDRWEGSNEVEVAALIVVSKAGDD